MFGDPAGHDTGEMLELGVQVDGDTVIRRPVPDPDADGGDLVFARNRVARGPAPDPDADPVVAVLSRYVKSGDRISHKPNLTEQREQSTPQSDN